MNKSTLFFIVVLVLAVGCQPAPTSTPAPTPVPPTATAMPPTATAAPTETPAPTATAKPTETPRPPTVTSIPKPLENLGPPLVTVVYPIEKATTGRIEWGSYYSRHETGGSIEVVDIADFPDSQSIYAPKTTQIFKCNVADVDSKQDTAVYMSVRGEPMRVPLRARIAIQVSSKFNQVIDTTGYNSLITLFNDTNDPAQGKTWSQWVDVSLRANGTLNFSSFDTNGRVLFTIRHDN